MAMPVMSVPSKRMAPLVGSSMPMMSLARVDLPPPLGPVMTVKRSSGMVSDRSSIIRLVPPSSAGTSNTRFFSSSMQCSLVSSRESVLVWADYSE